MPAKRLTAGDKRTIEEGRVVANSLSSCSSLLSPPRYHAFRWIEAPRFLLSYPQREPENERRRRRKSGRHRKNSHPGYPPRIRCSGHCRGHLDAFRGCTRVHQRIHSDFNLATYRQWSKTRRFSLLFESLLPAPSRAPLLWYVRAQNSKSSSVNARSSFVTMRGKFKGKVSGLSDIKNGWILGKRCKCKNKIILFLRSISFFFNHQNHNKN